MANLVATAGYGFVASRYGKELSNALKTGNFDAVKNKMEDDINAAGDYIKNNWPNAIGMPVGMAFGYLGGTLGESLGKSRIAKKVGKVFEALDDFGDVADYFDMIDPYGYNFEVARNDLDEPAISVYKHFEKLRIKKAEELAKDEGGVYDPGNWYEGDNDIQDKPPYSPEFKALVEEKLKALGTAYRYITSARIGREEINDPLSDKNVGSCLYYDISNPADERNLFLNTENCPQNYIDFYTDYYKANAYENQIRNCLTSNPINYDQIIRDQRLGKITNNYKYPFGTDIYEWQCMPNNLNAVKYNPFSSDPSIVNLYGYWEKEYIPSSTLFPTQNYLEVYKNSGWINNRTNFRVANTTQITFTTSIGLEQAQLYAIQRGYDILCFKPGQTSIFVGNSRNLVLTSGVVENDWTTYQLIVPIKDKILTQRDFLIQTSPIPESILGRAQKILGNDVIDLGNVQNINFTYVQTPKLPATTSKVEYSFTIEVYVNPTTPSKTVCLFSFGNPNTATNGAGPSPALILGIETSKIVFSLRQQDSAGSFISYNLATISTIGSTTQTPISVEKGLWNTISITVSETSIYANINGILSISPLTITPRRWSTATNWIWNPLPSSNSIQLQEIFIRNFYWWNQPLSQLQLSKLFGPKSSTLSPSYTLLSIPLSASCWIKINDDQVDTSRAGIIFGNWPNQIASPLTTPFNIEIFTNRNPRFFCFGQSLIFNSIQLDLDKWYFLTFVRDGLNVTVYVNGNNNFKQTLTLTTQNSTTLTSYYVGSDARNPPFYFNGEIFNLKVYYQTLSPVNVQTIFDIEIKNFKDQFPNSIIGNDPSEKFLINKRNGNQAIISQNKTNIGNLTYTNQKNSNNENMVSRTIGNAIVIGTVKTNIINQPITIEWNNQDKWRLIEKLWQNNGQLECVTSDGVSCENFRVWPAKTIVDAGYSDTQTRLFKRGYYDIVGQGVANDYCRYIGVNNQSNNETNPIHFSCQLSTGTNFASNKYGGNVEIDATSFKGQTISEIIGSFKPIYEPNPVVKNTINNFKLRSLQNNFCLAPNKSMGANGTSIIQTDCSDPYTYFQYDATTKNIKSSLNGKCLTVSNRDYYNQTNTNVDANDLQITISDCVANNTQQRWDFDSATKQIKKTGTNKCIAIGGSDKNKFGEKMVQWDCGAGNEFKFDQTKGPLPEGWYDIISQGVANDYCQYYNPTVTPLSGLANYNETKNLDISCTVDGLNQCINTVQNTDVTNCLSLCQGNISCQGIVYDSVTKECKIMNGVEAGQSTNKNKTTYKKKQFLPEMMCNLSSLTNPNSIVASYNDVPIADRIKSIRDVDVNQPYTESSRTRVQESKMILSPTAQVVKSTPSTSGTVAQPACSTILPKLINPQALNCGINKIFTVIFWKDTITYPGVIPTQPNYNVKKDKIVDILTILKNNFSSSSYSVSISSEDDLNNMINQNKQTVCNWGHYLAKDGTYKTGLPQFVVRDASGNVVSGNCIGTLNGIVPLNEPVTVPRSLFITITINDPTKKKDTTTINEVATLIKKNNSLEIVSTAYTKFINSELSNESSVCSQGKTFLDKIDEKSNLGKNTGPTTNSLWKGCQIQKDVYGNNVWYDSKLRVPYEFADNGGYCFPTAEERTICEPIDCQVTPWLNLNASPNNPVDTPVLFGDFITGDKSAESIQKLPSGERVYMVFESPFTKMVTQAGVAKFYTGALSSFVPSNWSTYASTGGIQLKWNPGNQNNSWSQCNVADVMRCKELINKGLTLTELEKSEFAFNNCTQLKTILDQCDTLTSGTADFTRFKCANYIANKDKCSTIEPKIINNTATDIEKNNYFNRWNCVPYVQKRVREQANKGAIYGGVDCPNFTEYKRCDPIDCQISTTPSDITFTAPSDKYFIYLLAKPNMLAITQAEASSLLTSIQKYDIKARLVTQKDLQNYNLYNVNLAGTWQLYRNNILQTGNITISSRSGNTSTWAGGVITYLNILNPNNSDQVVIQTISTIFGLVDNNLTPTKIIWTNKSSNSNSYVPYGDEWRRLPDTNTNCTITGFGNIKFSDGTTCLSGINPTQVAILSLLSRSQIKSIISKTTQTFSLINDLSQTSFTTERNLSQECIAPKGVSYFCTWADEMEKKFGRTKTTEEINFCQNINVNRYKEMKRQIISEARNGGTECPNPYVQVQNPDGTKGVCKAPGEPFRYRQQVLTEAQIINQDLTVSTPVLSTVPDTTTTAPNCIVSKWSNFSSCYFDTGLNKWVQKSYRQVLTPQTSGGSCPQALDANNNNNTQPTGLIQVQDCAAINCQVGTRVGGVGSWYGDDFGLAGWTGCFQIGSTQFPSTDPNSAFNGKWVKIRTREILQQPRFGGAACQPLFELAECADANKGGNFVQNCETSDWGQFTKCYKNAAGGWVKSRFKNITKLPLYGGSACPSQEALTETVNCTTADGVGSVEFDTVTEGDYSTPIKIGANWVQVAQRKVKAIPIYPVAVPLSTDLQTTRSVAPVNCVVGWGGVKDATSAFTNCYKNDAGAWVKSQFQEIITPAAYGGTACPTNLTTTVPCAAQNCEYTPFSDWSSCYFDNNGNYVRSKTRSVAKHGTFGGVECKQSDLIQTESCDKKECQVSAWTAPSSCYIDSDPSSPTFNQWVQTRTRDITQLPVGTTQVCPPLIETVSCTQNVDCVVVNRDPVGDFAWTTRCFDKDGRSVRARVSKEITTPAKFGGKACPSADSLIEYKNCDITAVDCEIGWNGVKDSWSPWSGCFIDDDGKYREYRTRQVTKQASDGGSCNITLEDLIQSKECTPINCAFTVQGPTSCYQKEDGNWYNSTYKVITQVPINGGQECPENLVEETLCSTLDCKAGFLDNGVYKNEWRDYDGKCYQKEANGPIVKLQYKNIIEDGRNGGKVCGESDLFQEIQCTQAELNALSAQATTQTTTQSPLPARLWTRKF